jgi:hypothetical protein
MAVEAKIYKMERVLAILVRPQAPVNSKPRMAWLVVSATHTEHCQPLGPTYSNKQLILQTAVECWSLVVPFDNRLS